MAVLTTKIINDRLRDRGIKLVGRYTPSRKNQKVKNRFRCAEGHEWDAMPYQLFAGHGCPLCKFNQRLTPERVAEQLAGRGISLIGDIKTARDKSQFKCDHGHEWTAEIQSVTIGGRGCPVCAGKLPLTTEIVNDRLMGRPFSMIGDYVNAHTKSQFKCDEGHIFIRTPFTALRLKGCPQCRKRKGHTEPPAPYEVIEAMALLNREKSGQPVCMDEVYKADKVIKAFIGAAGLKAYRQVLRKTFGAPSESKFVRPHKLPLKANSTSSKPMMIERLYLIREIAEDINNNSYSDDIEDDYFLDMF
ncbi:TPA: hypothetical protein JG871_003922 [Enterobacter hormaechei subsp. xiangfangensis]|nr:hypothetical protein [Enterobacter hormaechei subsp. xiangfangensis]